MDVVEATTRASSPLQNQVIASTITHHQRRSQSIGFSNKISPPALTRRQHEQLQRCTILKQQPFRDDAPLVGPPPSCSWASFKQPRLRKCPFDLASIEYLGLLGGGLDGLVWKVNVGDEGPFALKVFWESEPPPGPSCWAAQLECQNAALLQMIASSAERGPESIHLHREPWENPQAIENLYAFSDEGRERRLLEGREDVIRVTPTPHLRGCFGWATIPGATLADLRHTGNAPPNLELNGLSRELDLGRDHLAILYEYIPSGDNDHDPLQEAIDFIWRTGFMFFSAARDVNWESNVLLDLSELATPFQVGHARRIHAKHGAERLTARKIYPDYRWTRGRLPNRGSVPEVDYHVYSRFIWLHQREAWLARWNEQRRGRLGEEQETEEK